MAIDTGTQGGFPDKDRQDDDMTTETTSGTALGTTTDGTTTGTTTGDADLPRVGE